MGLPSRASITLYKTDAERSTELVGCGCTHKTHLLARIPRSVSFFFALTALLSHFLHTVKLTLFKCMRQ